MLVLAPLLLASSSASISTYDETTAKYFYHLSGAAYCVGMPVFPTWTCAPCGRVGATPTSMKSFKDTATDVYGYVAQVNGDIIVAFRGTETWKNWIEDIEIAKTDADMSCSGCKVHSGFLNCWTNLGSDMLTEVRRLLALTPSAAVYTTGHSLGGAVAMIAAYVLEYDEKIPISGVYSYGSPRVGNKEFATYYNQGQHLSWRVTHNNDPVPHLPPEAFGFTHIANEVYYNADSTVHHVCDGSGEDDKCADQHGIIDFFAIDDHLHYYGEAIGEDACATDFKDEGSWGGDAAHAASEMVEAADEASSTWGEWWSSTKDAAADTVSGWVDGIGDMFGRRL